MLRQAARTVRNGGRIINISSSSVRFTPAGLGAYATSKTGANTTIGVLASELGARGITANSIMVGAVAAGFLDPSNDTVRNAPQGMMESMAAMAPAGRLGLPSDIGPIACSSRRLRPAGSTVRSSWPTTAAAADHVCHDPRTVV